MWLLHIFEREFGFSDVQSNYSRVYAWMANQLGHMTLGLATVLFFVWIVESVFTFSNRALEAGGIWEAACRECEAGDCGRNVLIVAGLLAASAALSWAGQKWASSIAGYSALAAFVGAGVFWFLMGGGCAACLNYALLFVAMTVLLGAVAYIYLDGIALKPFRAQKKKAAEADDEAAKWARERDKLIAAELPRRFHTLTPSGVWLLNVVAFGLTFGYVWHFWPSQIALWTDPIASNEPRLFAIIVATHVVAAGCVKLCKDTRFIVIGAMALIASFMIATGGATLGPEGDDFRDSAPVGLAIVFVAYTCFAMVVRARETEKYSPRETVTQFAANTLIAYLFYVAMDDVANDSWRLAIGGGVASLTLWWVKEFGSDLPNVHREIVEVAVSRPGYDPEGKPIGPLGDCRQLERDYFVDARMDARTDALFYLAGAWIGAGVVTDISVLTDAPEASAGVAAAAQAASWSSGSEILGFLVFLAIFLGLGKNWAYRQLALDLMGGAKASRLAVFRSELYLRIIYANDQGHVRNDSASSGENLSHPLLALRGFSLDDEGGAPDVRDVDFREPMSERRFHHLIVFGHAGSGRGPLGRAIASEAALAHWPTLFFQRRRKIDPDQPYRSARFISAKHLLGYHRDISKKSDLSANPTVPYYVHKQTLVAERYKGDWEPGNYEEVHAASLVVIDETQLSDLGEPKEIKELLDHLSVEDGQQTVWLIECPDAGDAEAEETLGQKIEEASGLINELARRTRAGDRRRIAVGFARRAA